MKNTKSCGSSSSYIWQAQVHVHQLEYLFTKNKYSNVSFSSLAVDCFIFNCKTEATMHRQKVSQ